MLVEVSELETHCQTLIPGYDPWATAEGCEFDLETAQHYIDFFHLALVHVKGEKAGQSFELEPWQQALVGNLFGWKRPDGTRRYRECLLYVPRKNGKSLLASGICNALFLLDGEPGAEIYCAAAERQQAALVFEVAKEQILRNKTLKEVCRPYRNSIVIKQNASSFKPISSDASTKHGYNAHGVCVDELHAQKDRELVDVLETSMGTRRQPLMVYCTTADYWRDSICNEKYKYAQSVRDGVFRDRSFLPVIYEARREDDWTSEEIWAKANPNYGISVKPEFLREQCQKAKQVPSFENTFKRMYLNVQTENAIRWIKMDSWKSCGGAFDEDVMKGRTCYGGLDLSANQDITAFVLICFTEGLCYVRPYFWVPVESADEKEKKDRVPYNAWRRQGFVRYCDGKTVDYRQLEADILEICQEYDVDRIATDPWNAHSTMNNLVDSGLDIVQVRQTPAALSSPSKALESLIVDGKLRHGDNPVLNWMASHVMAVEDDNGNIKPSKKQSTERIDGIIATVMALSVAEQDDSDSYYETHGLDII